MALNDLTRDELISLVLITSLILLFKYVYTKIYSDFIYAKDFSLPKKRQSFFKSDLPPVYPNGWITVARSSSIKNDNKIHESFLCGNDIILFRDESSNAICLDAYCPHLGANLAFGGDLLKHKKETCIKCPFHGWLFNKNGKCVNVPYSCSKDIPKGASIKSYLVKELNGFIYVWYHADDESPSWYPEDIEEISSKKWNYMGSTDHIVSCHFQEIAENGADVAHLNSIHQGSVFNGRDISNQKLLNNLITKYNYHVWHAEYDLTDDELSVRMRCESFDELYKLNRMKENSIDSNGNTVDQLNRQIDKNRINPIDDEINGTVAKLDDTKKPHVVKSLMKKRTFFFSVNIFNMKINVEQIGPSIVHLRFKIMLLFGFNLDAIFVQSIQPLGPFKHKITHNLYTKDGFIKRIISKLLLIGEAKMFERDIFIWNHKKFLKKAFILKNEKPIVKYRKWFQQFYSPNSSTVESLKDGLDW